MKQSSECSCGLSSISCSSPSSTTGRNGTSRSSPFFGAFSPSFSLYECLIKRWSFPIFWIWSPCISPMRSPVVEAVRFAIYTLRSFLACLNRASAPSGSRRLLNAHVPDSLCPEHAASRYAAHEPVSHEYRGIGRSSRIVSRMG